MKFKMTFLVVCGFLISGCQQANNDSYAQLQTEQQEQVATFVDPTPTQPIVAKQINATPSAAITPKIAKIIPTPEAQPSEKINKTAKAKPQVVDLWQPNEAQLSRGNELILGLQSEINREPSVYEQQKRLQTHMGLTEAQAKKIISGLGQPRT